MRNKFILAMAIFTNTSSFIMSRPKVDPVAIEFYTTSLRYMLHTLPQDEINEIEQKVRYELQSAKIHETNTINQIINSVLVEHVRTKIALDIKNTEKQWGIYFSNQDREKLKSYHLNQFIDHIGTLSFIEGNKIAPFFGTNRTNTIQQSMHNILQARHSANQPTQHVTPKQQLTSNTREVFALKHAQTVANQLNGSLPANDINLLQSFIIDSTRSVLTVPAEDQLTHTKNGLAQLLDIKLETSRKTLTPIILNHGKLNDSIESTRLQNGTAIEKLTSVDSNKIRNLLGSDDFGNDNITEKVIENMGIRCPVCFEEFREELREDHRCGKPSRVILKAEDKNKSCGHAVCKQCAPGCNNKCPQCRASVDRQDLKNKMNANAPQHGKAHH